MTAPANTAFQINMKTPSGTLINLYGETEQESKDQLDSIGRILKDVGTIEAALGAMEAVQGVTQASGRRGASSSAAPAEDPDAPECKHGAMTWRSGTGRKGEWQAYFCPTPKGTAGQCDPTFLNKGEKGWR